MFELKVPFAVDENGVLVDPSGSEKGKSYSCPACGVPVVFKKGAVKVPHFAHLTGTNCSQESIVHKTAKRLVQQMVINWRSGSSSAPVVLRVCRVCGEHIEQPLPDKVTSALLEYRLLGGRIVDVALMSGDQPVAAVEIRVCHAVDDVKSADLPVPFIEVDGVQLLSNPALWVPIVDKFKSPPCPSCTEVFERFKKATSKIAKENGVTLPTEYFDYSYMNCWRCGKRIIVYRWPDKIPKPKVGSFFRPKSIQYRFSKTVNRKYWSNTCVYCHSLIGDWFLTKDPESPFGYWVDDYYDRANFISHLKENARQVSYLESFHKLETD
jgi:hypothetical protein